MVFLVCPSDADTGRRSVRTKHHFKKRLALVVAVRKSRQKEALLFFLRPEKRLDFDVPRWLGRARSDRLQRAGRGRNRCQVY